MTDIQIKNTDICKQVFLSILPTFVEFAKQDIEEGETCYSAIKLEGKSAVDAAINIAREWLEYLSLPSGSKFTNEN
jgi:hypothetical protein